MPSSSSITPGYRRSPVICVPVFAVAAMSLLWASESRVLAGADSVPAPVRRTTWTAVAIQPTPTPKLKITKAPYLIAVGPTGIDVHSLAGPRVRRPPLLPPPKVVKNEPEATPAPNAAAASKDTKAPALPEPSAFSPDAPPVLLPAEKPVNPPAPSSDRRSEPTESVLSPSGQAEPDLKDAIIYFNKQIGHGSRIVVPESVPYSAPTTPAQPPSRATYHEEKE